MAEPCGSQRVLRVIEGHEADVRWCERTEGDCPFPGTDKSKHSDRRCATEPGTVLHVHWSDDLINDAYNALYLESQGATDAASPTREQRQIAVDALRACGAER